ncbi:tetratricopeptide repeat protein, partial [Candidatus Chloroploca sp. M-50]
MNEPPPNIALVIGVNGGPETGLAPLRFAEETAQQVARALVAPACGFTLHGDGPLLGAAATTDAVRRAIFDARRAAGRTGLLLIYYIGHGRYVEVGRSSSDVFLVTHNFRPGDARDDPNAHLSMQWLQETVLRHDDPDRLLLVLDCCFAGAVSEAAPDPLVVNLVKRLEEALNLQRSADGATGATMRKALAAVSPLHKAYEGDGTTAYSAALLRGLHGTAVMDDGRVTWQSLHAYLQNDLTEAQSGEYGFDRSAGATLAYYPDRARLRTPAHQPFIMPHPPMSGFVGREEALAQLAMTLTGEHATSAALLPAVAGIGGIGKTRLAIEFVHRYREHFPDGIFWLSMENPDGVVSQVAACGGQRGLQLFDEGQDEQFMNMGRSFGSDGLSDRIERAPRLSLHQQAEQVRAIWETPGRRLLIFDNLEDPALLELWRPRGGGSRVLITTRRQSWAPRSSVRPFPLGVLLDDASQALLLGPRALERACPIESLLADPREAEAAAGLVGELGGHALALTLCGGYLARSAATLGEYLAQLRAESIRHRSLSPELAEGLPQGQQASIVASFALSYGRLGAQAEHARARMLWLTAAQLAPQPIPVEVLLRATGLDPADESQRERGEEALRLLRELGLIERSADTYQLHRLMIAYARSVSTDQPGDRRRAARGLAQTIQRLDDEGELSAPLFREHITHLLDAGAPEHDSEGAALLHSAGLVLIEAEDYARAGEYLRQALDIRSEVLGRQHRDTAITLHALGNVAQAEDDYPAARQSFQEALAIKTAVLGRQHRS